MLNRKETWEKIRRRPSKLNTRSDKNSQDVWIKRESVHTQTKLDSDNFQDPVDSSSGLDDSLPRMKASRPSNLPLGKILFFTIFKNKTGCFNFIFKQFYWTLLFFAGLSQAASSSLSSGELLETPPRAPSSPSAASLQLQSTPLTVELTGKSSSAPLLENNRAEKSDTSTAVSDHWESLLLVGLCFSKVCEVSCTERYLDIEIIWRRYSRWTMSAYPIRRYGWSIHA